MGAHHATRSVCRRRPTLALAVAGLLGGVILESDCPAATISFTDTGISSTGTPLAVAARIDTGADAGGPQALTLTLRSVGAATVSKSDVLTSFYFNITDASGARPHLNVISGTGQAYQVNTSGSDTPVSWKPDLLASGGTWTTSGPHATDPSTLIATRNSNEGWQFLALTTPPTAAFGFGIGTVGNSKIGTFVPELGGGIGNFDGRVVQGTRSDSMINLGIFSTGTGGGTDITPNGGLDGARLVRSEAVFRFTSQEDLTTYDVGPSVAFGFGTNPDTVLLPEPGGLGLLAALAACLGVAARRGRSRSRPAP